MLLYRYNLCLAGLLLGAAWPAAVTAMTYGECTSLIGLDAKKAVVEARRWSDHGGGAGADHCLALAFVEQGQFANGAQVLESMANHAYPDPANPNRSIAFVGKERADLLSQAGNAWLYAGNADKAYSLITQAIGEGPLERGDLVELYVDRAIVLAQLGDNVNAIADLDEALLLQPDRVDILVLRATAYRQLEAFSKAQEDLTQALVLAPDDPDALNERGNVLLLLGDRNGAEQHWRKVVELAPRSLAAEESRRHLAEQKKQDTPLPNAQ